MDRLRFSLAMAGGLLGAAHITFGLFNFRPITLEFIWFAGAGVAMIMTALVNLGDRWADLTTRLINLMMASYVLGILAYAPLPQVFLGAAIFSGLLLLSFRKPLHVKN